MISFLGPSLKPEYFRRNDDLIAIPSSFHPFPYPFFRLALMVEVGDVDEVPAGFEIRVEEGEAFFFGDFTGIA